MRLEAGVVGIARGNPMNEIAGCARCILPGSYPGIVFDEDGVCNYCDSHRRWTPLGLQKLEEIVDGYRGKHPRYDCIAAVSGGRDSSYMLWYAVRSLGLRTLAVTVKTGCSVT